MFGPAEKGLQALAAHHWTVVIFEVFCPEKNSVRHCCMFVSGIHVCAWAALMFSTNTEKRSKHGSIVFPDNRCHRMDVGTCRKILTTVTFVCFLLVSVLFCSNNTAVVPNWHQEVLKAKEWKVNVSPCLSESFRNDNLVSFSLKPKPETQVSSVYGYVFIYLPSLDWLADLCVFHVRWSSWLGSSHQVGL